MNRRDRLVFTGLGMVTSLGLDVVTACAAARAGILRAVALEDFPVRSLDNGEVSGVITHAAPEITRGFEGRARLLRLIQAALQDLLRQTTPGVWDGLRVGFYLSLPNPARIHEGGAWLKDKAVRDYMEKRGREAQLSLPPAEEEARALLQKAAAEAGWPGASMIKFATRSGRPGVAESSVIAAGDLRAEAIDIAVVGGVDSLLEEDVLIWLGETGRLKSPNAPVGLQPGEGAAFLALETERQARRRGSKPLGCFDTHGTGVESCPWTSGQMAVGDGYAQALSQAIEAAGDKNVPWLILDHAGESYSANDWGFTMVRLTAKGSPLTQTAVWYPAASFGETGAAYGAIAACMVLRAFARGYAPATSALIAAAALGPGRSVLRITRHTEAR